jgi:hypothetical protein
MSEDWTVTGWVVVAFLACAVYAWWLVGMLRGEQLTRCPKTGAVTLVRFGLARGRPGAQRRLEIRSCGLWPDHSGCGQGCLARPGEVFPPETASRA